MSTDNKRKFPRVSYPCSLTLLKGNSFETINAITSNIGAGGLLVFLDQSLMIGAKAEIKVDFPKDGSFECVGRVLRCQFNKDGTEETSGKFSIALGFEALDENKVAYLRERIETLIKQESVDSYD